MNDYEYKIIRKRLRISGSVQGVGFRYRAERAAGLIGATGWVLNDPNGAVSMELQGTEEQIDRVIRMVSQETWVEIESIEPGRFHRWKKSMVSM